MKLIKPPRLQHGDVVASISLSGGMAADFPHHYEAGKRQLSEAFGLKVIETPHALESDDWLYQNPKARAEDLHWALENPKVKGIISTIGGDDSVRILPFLDFDLINKNPKIFMGFSDSTITLMAFALAGVGSFHGPAMMTDLAENGGIKPFVKTSLQETLFESSSRELKVASHWSEEFKDWANPNLQSEARSFQKSKGWHWLQGNGVVSGHLLGGCIEVLEFLKGTPWWLPERLWQNAILFLETSEEAPPPSYVAYWLRNYGMQGILEKISGLLFARPMRYSSEHKQELNQQIKRILAEFGRQDLSVITNLDFGHTSPQLILPLGCQAEIDPIQKTIRVLEPAVT